MTGDDEPPPDGDEPIEVAPPTLTPEEEAEARRLYAELLDEIAKGDTWGLNPKDDR